MKNTPKSHIPSDESIPVFGNRNTYYTYLLDSKGRLIIPADVREHFKLNTGRTFLVCFNETSIHIVLDEMKMHEILTLDASKAPAYEVKQIDSQGRVLFGSNLLKSISKTGKKQKVHQRYHNGILDVLFDKDMVEEEQKQQFANTKRLFCSHETTYRIQDKVARISMNWNTDPLKSYRKKESEQK